uniref:RNA-dependent RNA polymerase n=1 Tax=Port Orford cedar deltapartitivirus TaxID=2933095 RepID=A0A9C7GWI8_9VIRU|nr:RNA-dependent RNA polymerase [Port Orford cedar deltapartitivirus]CAI5383888.1 RNA-dependent RNA polymerase [Port Orford cedar deltapartitivirus]
MHTMDHRFRSLPRGLIELGQIPERRLREEFQIIIDPYINEAINDTINVTLIRELDGWARSFYTIEGQMMQISKYDRLKLPEPALPAWNAAKQHARNVFRTLPHVRAISYQDFDSVKWLRASAAGYGYVGTKGDNDNYHKAKKTAVTIAEKLNHDRSYGPQALESSTPDIAFTRTQLSQIKVKRKVRNVWGEAFHYVLLEGLFADPLIQLFKECQTFYFIGKDPLLAVPALIQEILIQYDYVYMFDWSSFDSSVQEWEIRFAFELLESILVFPTSVEEQIWRFVIELFIYRKIACPDGTLKLKTLGIPSGSCFTNIIGSIVNYVRILFVFIKLTSKPAEAFTHGDDSLAAVNSEHYIPIQNIKEVCDPFQWELNATKSDVSNRAEGINFLSRTVRAGQNYRDELTALRMAKYPEHPVLEGRISTLRVESILLDSGLNSHNLFRIFKYLEQKYGKAENLPRQLARWNPLEYESLRLSYDSTM